MGTVVFMTQVAYGVGASDRSYCAETKKEDSSMAKEIIMVLQEAHRSDHWLLWTYAHNVKSPSILKSTPIKSVTP